MRKPEGGTFSSVPSFTLVLHFCFSPPAVQDFFGNLSKKLRNAVHLKMRELAGRDIVDDTPGTTAVANVHQHFAPRIIGLGVAKRIYEYEFAIVYHDAEVLAMVTFRMFDLYSHDTTLRP
jgi:hypothetical protein